jgi:cyclase
MHIFSSERGAARARSFASRRTWWAGLVLLAAASFYVAVAGQEKTAQKPPQAPQPAFGDPVNLYARNTDPYAPPQGDGKIQPWHVRGRVWLMAGGESNVTVHVGDQGVLVVDTGTQAMAPKLLAQIQRLAQERGGTHKAIRTVVNTNGRADHIGGNEIIRKAGSQVIAGEERAQQTNFGTPGAEVFAHENVQARMVAENVPQALWPTDLEGFESDGRRFNGEAVQIYHPRSANTDGQLIVLFRESDVLAAGDVVDMTGYPIVDVARGGTIDGLLIALNKVIDMAVPDKQADGGTLIVPGRGRLATQTDVVLYKNMITIIRNLVQYYKNQGKTLEEVLALKPSEGYDQRWGRTSGPWTTRDFITAVYNTLPAKGPVFFSIAN